MEKENFPIDPIHFWNVFSESLHNKFYKNNDKQIRTFNIYQNNKPWTKFLTKFLLDLSEEFSCNSMKEYWPKVDVAYFNDTRDYWDKWSFEVAIEIENDSKTWWKSEFNKLMSLNCGLKVIVTYDSTDNASLLKWLNGNGANDDYSNIRKIYKSRKYHQKNDNWLIIFGPCADKKNNYSSLDDFRAFTFSGDKFTQLEKKKILSS